MTRKCKRRIQKIARVICGLGFLFLLGTVGAYETDGISTTQFLLQTAAGMAAFAGGGVFGGLMR